MWQLYQRVEVDVGGLWVPGTVIETQTYSVSATDILVSSDSYHPLCLAVESSYLALDTL